MFAWIDAKMKRLLADACADGATPKLQKSNFLIIGIMVFVLVFIVFPLLLIIFYLGVNFVFG